MTSTTKLIGDGMALVLILFILVLAIVSIAAVWQIIEVKDVLYKAVFSFSILLIAYVIVITAARYWETHQAS